MSGFSRIALIGFGEVGQILAADLVAAGVEDIALWDVVFACAESAPSRAPLGLGVARAPDASSAVAGADLVISAVTAAEDLAAARQAAPGLASRAAYLDLNSASPSQKVAAAKVIEAAGGRYVEAAVMTPFPPRRMASPMLLGGPHAVDMVAPLAALGFAGARVFSPIVGRAAAAKLCRSVMIKGIEALLAESLLAARHYGVEGEVLASLSDLVPAPDWPSLARYMIGRSIAHGGRRAEEMAEAASTMADVGIAPTMSLAIATRQAWAAQFADALASDALAGLLDAVNARGAPETGE